MIKEERIATIKQAIIEAKRFISRAENWKDRLKKDYYAQYSCKEGGACKRASMDLTRALAELRKP